MKAKAPSDPLLCPSAQPEVAESILFGVVTGTPQEPIVSYLKAPQAATAEITSLADPVSPDEVFRFAAPCVNSKCQHFDGSNCRLAKQIAKLLPIAVNSLPRCPLRPKCRWWQQEGQAACLRCPAIVTRDYNPSELLKDIATPEGVKDPTM